MDHIVSGLLHVSPWIVLGVTALLVFAEDALFFGFVIPGETAAVLGGVDASRGHTHVLLVALAVVAAAVMGDSVGYEVGRRFGPRLLRSRLALRHEARLASAQDTLRRRGGFAVFFGRFFAFFRAVMPALAGASRMPYLSFLRWNAVGGLVWGVGFVLLGYLAGSSYATIQHAVGTGVAIAAAALIVVGLAAWHLSRRRAVAKPAARDKVAH